MVKHVFPPFFAFPLSLKCMPKLQIEMLPPCIIHHFSWFFELVIMVIVLCMICIILHDHLSWFFTHLTSWGCKGQSWGLVGSQDGLTWKAYQCSWPYFWNHEENLTLDWVIQSPKKGLQFGWKSAKKRTVHQSNVVILLIQTAENHKLQ